MEWRAGDITILLPDGGELDGRGFIHGEIARADYQGEWLVLHYGSGLVLGRFASEIVAADLGARLVNAFPRGLRRLPQSWAEGLWERLEDIRAEVARENGLQPPPPLRATNFQAPPPAPPTQS